jgi:hypothetical protein
MSDYDELIREWRQQASVLIAASKDDGTSNEQRDLMIGNDVLLWYRATGGAGGMDRTCTVGHE